MARVNFRKLIERKREGNALSANDWQHFVDAVCNEPHHPELGALLMAIVWRGMTQKESVTLTRILVDSGRTLKFTRFANAVDKHSTGGVGDTASLIVVPLLAACGEHVAKLSGRALGHTGGTIDKLEAIPGLRTSLSIDEFEAIVADVGCAIGAQSPELAPADKALYALRDRTATVPSIGLITASIVSKKIAAGAQGIIFDVKAGSAAFMRTLAGAQELAGSLVHTSEAFGKSCVAVVTDMHQPLSPYVGTGLEVLAACDFLQGKSRPSRLREVVLRLGCELLAVRTSFEEAEERVTKALESGLAFDRFERMVRAQGGDLRALQQQAPPPVHEAYARMDGYLSDIDGVALGHLARELSEAHGALGGLRVDVSHGERIVRGQRIGMLYGDESRLKDFEEGMTVSEHPAQEYPLIYATQRSGQANTAGVV